MKTELAALIVALVGANGFMLPSSQKFSTELSGEMRNSDWAYNAFGSVGQENFFYRDNDQSNDQIGSGWAYDPYGRNEQEGGKVPTQLVDEGDSWFYHPWGGVAQTDFYPMGHAGNQLVAAEATSPPASAPAAEEPAAGEPMPEPTVAIPEQAMAQA